MLRIFSRLRNYYFLVQVGRDTESAVLAIPEANPVFEAPVRFSIDGVTEKVTDGNLKYFIIFAQVMHMLIITKKLGYFL